MLNIEVSIIIVSFNTCEILKNCIFSIKNANLKFSYEIIIIDNASTDESVLMLETLFPEIILLKNTSNLMFSKANNIGIEMASGKFILLLNSDIIVIENELEKLYHFLIQNPLISTVGPRVLNFDGSVQSESFPFDSLHNLFCNYFKIIKWPIPLNLKLKILPYGFIGFQNGITRKTGWISGCCMLIDKNILKNRIGLLDEDLFFYGEDVEWCYRAKKMGESVYVKPDSKIIHLGGASTSGEVLFKIKARSLDNYIRFSLKTVGLYQVLMINIFTLISHIFVFPFLLVRYKKFHKKWKSNLLVSLYTLRKIIFYPDI